MKPLIIIPARGGSKGIPRKNIKPLGGVPLIAHSIRVALSVARKCGLPQENILVSTDDEEIAAVAAGYGAPTPYRRPDALATDSCGSREVMIDAMHWAGGNGVGFDCVLLLQPTSPFRSVEDVMGTLALYEERHPDMAVSVKAASANPYYNCFEASDDGVLHVAKGAGLLTRRQDAPPAWEFNGAVYVINPESLERMPMGLFPVRIGYEMDSLRSLDLDTMLDWAVAEALVAGGYVSLPTE